MGEAHAFMEDVPDEPTLSVCSSSGGINTYLLNGVKMAICPFDRSHIMLANRLPQHLRKCLKQHKGEKLVCPFNASEYVDAEVMNSHLMTCTSRTRVMVQEWNSAQTKEKGHLIPSPPVDQTVPYVIDKYW